MEEKMKRILILGEDKKRTFAKSLLSILKNSGYFYLFASDNGFYFNGSEKDADFTIISTINCKKIVGLRADIVFVVGNKIHGLENINTIGKKSALFFVSPENEAIYELNKEYNNIIAFGAAEKNTVSVSSIDENKVILSVQRSILMEKTILEPQEIEIKVNMSKNDINAVIAGAICKLICPKTNAEE
jgi:hypothetical protein